MRRLVVGMNLIRAGAFTGALVLPRTGETGPVTGRGRHGDLEMARARMGLRAPWLVARALVIKRPDHWVEDVIQGVTGLATFPHNVGSFKKAVKAWVARKFLGRTPPYLFHLNDDRRASS